MYRTNMLPRFRQGMRLNAVCCTKKYLEVGFVVSADTATWRDHAETGFAVMHVS